MCEFHNWLTAVGLVGQISVTGKNFASFDSRFLDKISGWKDIKFFHRRVLDPGTLYFEPDLDSVLPDTKLCALRAGISLDSSHLHTAEYDARLVIELVRRYYETYRLESAIAYDHRTNLPRK